MKIFFSLIICLLTTASIAALPESDHAFRLIIFEGSDWCVKCRQLEKYVLSDTAVTTLLAKNNIELVRVDFPQRKAQSDSEKNFNAKIADQYFFAGKYPTVILSKKDANFHQQIKIGGNDPKEFQKQILEKIEILLGEGAKPTRD